MCAEICSGRGHAEQLNTCMLSKPAWALEMRHSLPRCPQSVSSMHWQDQVPWTVWVCHHVLLKCIWRKTEVVALIYLITWGLERLHKCGILGFSSITLTEKSQTHVPTSKVATTFKVFLGEYSFQPSCWVSATVQQYIQGVLGQREPEFAAWDCLCILSS